MYLIQVVEAQNLQFSITAFEVEIDQKDPFEYGSGSTVNPNQAIEQLDGSSQVIQNGNPYVFDITGNQAWITFRSDGSNQYSGFSLTYRAGKDESLFHFGVVTKNENQSKKVCKSL